MSLRILDNSIRQADIAVHARLPQLPCLLTLTAGSRTLLWPILVAEGAATCSQNHIRVTQVLEEGRQAKGVHATRDDRRGLLHALPSLVIVGPIRLVLLQHEGNVLIGGIALHLPKAHGAHMDAASADDARDLSVHKSRVPALRLGARDGAVPGPVVVQELLREVAASHRHRRAAGHVAIDEEGTVL